MDPDLPKDFVEAVAAQSDPDVVRSALKLTAKGSIAEAYVNHLANTSEAALDGGAPLSDQSTDPVAKDGFKSCDDVADEKSCVTFSDFAVDRSGKLADLKVNGKSLKDRVVAGNGQAVTSAGNKFTFLTAYKSIQSNALFISVKVESGPKKISSNIFTATYRSPDGKQRGATTAYGAVDLDAKSNTIVTMAFAGVAPGGRVTLDGCVGDCMTQFKAVLKVG